MKFRAELPKAFLILGQKKNFKRRGKTRGPGGGESGGEALIGRWLYNDVENCVVWRDHKRQRGCSKRVTIILVPAIGERKIQTSDSRTI